MRDNINLYLASLLIVIAGAMALWLIYRFVTQSPLPANFGGSEATYGQLQESILNQQP